MTKIMTQEDYRSCNGCKCPACGSEEIESKSNIEHQGSSLSQDVWCSMCKATWQDVFYLSGYDALVDLDQNCLMEK